MYTGETRTLFLNLLLFYAAFPVIWGNIISWGIYLIMSSRS
jgi:hypothetical protein